MNEVSPAVEDGNAGELDAAAHYQGGQVLERLGRIGKARSSTARASKSPAGREINMRRMNC